MKQRKIEKALVNWATIELEPPLTEVEGLRYIDQLKRNQYELESDEWASLYSLLAYHRFKRNQKDDKLLQMFLNEAEALVQNHPVTTEIKGMIGSYSFYMELESISANDWRIRETDYDPAKLKKADDLLKEVNRILSTPRENHSIYHSMLDLYKEIMNTMDVLANELSTTITMIENRKTNTQVQPINDLVKQIIAFRNQFYKQLPDVVKDAFHKSPLEKLNEMVGHQEVKHYIHQLYHYLKYQKKREQLGFKMKDGPGLHMIITGNPGTGKTTIARLIAEIYYELGLLETKKVTEVNRSHLVGSFLGQSEENTLNYVREALGGILFIDEAYSLKREGQSGNDYGQSVIDTLVSSMTGKEYGDEFATILAGFPDEMRQFLWANQGLRSRFPEQNQIELQDFNMEELLQIAENSALENDYFFTEKARNQFKNVIEKTRVDESFGNARTVRNLVLKSIFRKGSKKSSVFSDDDWIDHMRIDDEDLEYQKENRSQNNNDPLNDLDQLIGLDEVKDEVKKLSAFVSMQQKRKDAGFTPVPIQLHSVFTGNPGTGKTTVANIYAKVLKECGLLKRGHLIVASRSDLVAGYVGQTAIKTKQKIKESLGGVLFIDEAYSLARDKKGFGKEAIDTLVDEMTKHNDNLIVILAGYKKEMNELITSNPGLASRFKKYVEFKDYSPNQLVKITNIYANQYNYKFDIDGQKYIEDQFENNQINGNGRFAVNLVDEAIQYQALRLSKRKEITEDSMYLLTLEDVENAWLVSRGNNI
ncbi:AAA family ATPase [Aquibacillus sp. 3ASR75-11]|uniref:AAA family ATPase n=1 Tax=Terrihalobacillus insolitus TaxID=2950438 RepID=A0A9X4AN13_9BACI|nr:AAA family ATPase [Terrihalobacillus insolitus]MDC3415025.1 AAA family ATPase [Terrihalobacillus insolitus]MDC3425921.1 AAA family ATPase [Terrihalobacillus insolitus]